MQCNKKNKSKRNRKVIKLTLGGSLYLDKTGINRWNLTGQKNQIEIINYQDKYPLQTLKYNQSLLDFYKYLYNDIYKRTFNYIRLD